MQRPSKKSLIILSLAAALLALGGCAALRFGYNQAPGLAYWWMNRYADFDAAQGQRARSEIDAWFRWHRAQQLPAYAKQLDAAAQQVLEPTTPAQVCRWLDDIAVRVEPAFAQALPALADVALTLTPAQINHIAQRFEKVNEDFTDDFLQDDAEERLDAAVKRYQDRAESLYGRLQPAQRQRVRTRLATSPYDAQVLFAERRARQQDVLKTLRRLQAEGASPAQAQTALRALFVGFRQSPRPAYRAYVEKLTPYNCQVAAELHNSTTADQRRVASGKLKGWQEDLRVLAAAAAS